MSPEESAESGPLTDRCVVLLNPNARGGRAARVIPEMGAWLRTHHPGTELHVPASAVEASQLVGSLPTGSKVVAVGGDGTLNRLLPSILGGRHRLGIVAWGSGNDFARAHGLLFGDWRSGLAFALAAEEQRVDVGHVSLADREALFLSSLAAGFDAAVGLRALGGPRWLSGLPRYLWATLAEIAFLRRYRLRLEVEGGLSMEAQVLFASVLNSPTYGSGMPAVPHARTDDGALDLLIARRLGRLGTLVMLPRLLSATHLSHREVFTSSFQTVRVWSDDEVPLAADGEFLGMARAWSIGALPQHLRLLCAKPGAVSPSEAVARLQG